jgi:hypothetical protein
MSKDWQRRCFVLASTAGAALLLASAGMGQTPVSPTALREHPAIRYQHQQPADAVARLNERVRNGDVTLTFEPVTGYLRSVLALLDVSEDSQTLVFSKTSFQARRINPSNPRAIFFNDTAAVGWVRGGEVLEFVVQDARQGAVFYTLEQQPSATPQFRRDQLCVQCHTTEATSYVPGMFVMSVMPATDGTVLHAPIFGVDHRTPFDTRWGGWYVTGRTMSGHMGNAAMAPGAELDTIVGTRESIPSLEGRFDLSGYPRAQSDVVALMVLEHQARMLNLLTRLGWEARIAGETGAIRQDLVNEVVDYLLFVDEPLLPAPVAGSSTYAATFASRGPWDRKGRSLRDLDLRSRLMRYPCSFLVYSEPFDALPARARNAVYARMRAILTGEVQDARYLKMPREDRNAVLEILADTKADFPDDFSRIASS